MTCTASRFSVTFKKGIPLFFFPGAMTKMLVGLGVKGERRQGQPGEVGCEFHPPGFHSGDKPEGAGARKNFL